MTNEKMMAKRKDSKIKQALGLFCVWGLILIALLRPSLAEDEPLSRAEEAEELYSQAMGVMKDSLEEKSLSEAVSLLERAAKLDPSREDIWVQLSWNYWMLGDALPKTRKEKKGRLELYKKGMSAGKNAIDINPRSAGGLFWYTVNMAAMGETKGILSSLWMGGTIFSNMSRVDRRDPDYIYGGTRRFSSELLIGVPKWLVEKFGFRPEHIEDDLREDIQKWPDYLVNYVYLAKVYWWDGEKDKALEQLEYVISRNPHCMPEEKAENIRQQKAARILWKRYTGKEFPEK